MKTSPSEYKQILAQRFQNHATAMEQGKNIQPTSLNTLYYLFDGNRTGDRIMLKVFEFACEEKETRAHEVEHELITYEEMENILLLCWSNFENPDEKIEKELLIINKKLHDAQPGKKRIWVHATRRKAIDKYALLSECMTAAAVDSFPWWLGLEIAKLTIFDYIGYRYRMGELSSNRLRRLSNIIIEA